MGEEINIERIEVVGDEYQIEFKFVDRNVTEIGFIRKDALFALLCVAEGNDMKHSPDI